ncbi:Glycosyltransferase involved in cell wall bisynthesis [Chishuiella changwenlii]|uniref:Glycosyl transferase n=1 Tax=Chishuiella changwenlii TaxID=1434701 RepID=A0A1M6U1Q1_9FLAO|nr:glycosyltransferase family 2 protein [Chishuiella changwenlii]GGF08683.1 glycosyl transferase [Chishuiella changwenlii]SHK63018.1 Glycosyltransferase involved in cell wall bisynthesis [Chishuiella changwenlii]
MDLVSIITPCYNSEQFIVETYQSIFNQTYKNWEWIIVDDCSKDNSVELIKSFNDDRVKLFVQDNNQGAAVARNKALDIAKGKYITFIDSDDLWLPNFLETTINYLENNNENLVYTSYKRVDENLNFALNDFIAIDKINRNRILYNCPIPMLTSVYNASEIGIVKFPDVELREDHAMWIDLLERTKYARAIKESLAIYRMRENSVSRNKWNIAIKQYNVYNKYLRMNIIQSSYYTFFWALNGLKKYGKF